MISPFMAEMLRSLGIPAVPVSDGKPEPATKSTTNQAEARSATEETKADSAKKLKAGVIDWIRREVGDEGLDVAKLGHLAGLVASGAVSLKGLAGVLSTVKLARGMNKFTNRDDVDVVRLFWDHVEKLPGWVEPEQPAERFYEDHREEMDAPVEPAKPAEKAADVQAAVKAFNDMVHAEFAKLHGRPLPSVRRECYRPERCRRLYLDAMAKMAAEFYWIAAHADELFVASK